VSTTDSPLVFVDPLAQESIPSAQPRRERPRSSAPRDRAALLAPDVEGCSGARAIDLVRSRGLIAAIETMEMARATQHGLVIEQDPSAGTRMVREGVVTLRVAQVKATPQASADSDEVERGQPSSSSAAGKEDSGDDTAEWFAALSPPLGDSASGIGVGAPCRRRKHRRAAIPVDRVVFDTPPDPLPAVCSPQPAVQRQLSQRERGRLGPLASVAAALLVRLPTVSAMWRRRVLVLTGAFVGIVIFTRSWGSHPHYQVLAPLARLPFSFLRVTTSPPSPSVRKASRRRVASLRSGAFIRHSRAHRAPRKPVVIPEHAEARAVAKPASTIVVRDAPSAPQPTPATVDRRSAPFIYLGK
jgi:hypothetical protein